MYIPDNEREESLEFIVDMYAPGDIERVLRHMPIDRDDPSAEKYNKYSVFLQVLYALRGDYDILSAEELEEQKQELRKLAAQFNYPTDQIDVLRPRI